MLKKELRNIFLDKRKNLSAKEMEMYSHEICQAFFHFFTIDCYQNIHIFLPIQKNNEIDTWLIINNLRNKFPNIKVIIPRIISDGMMENYLFTKESILVENSLKILEPIQNPRLQIQNQAIDLVLLPLIIFDKNGYRVGYGKGFYDRFLATCRTDVLKVGLSIFDPVEEIEDINEFDIKMDYCITPNKVWAF